jgi:hypothetical protein
MIDSFFDPSSSIQMSQFCSMFCCDQAGSREKFFRVKT